MKEVLMIQRQSIRDLAPNSEVDSVFLLGGASLQQSRNGPYWRLELRDAGGTLEAKIWSPLSSSFHDLTAGQLVQIRGRVGTFRDQLQLTVDELHVLTDEEIAETDLAQFMPSSSRPVPEMQEELESMIERELTHLPWKRFVRSVLEEDRVRRALPVAPAARSVHHAYVGGLLEHMLSVAGLCLRIAEQYPELDRQLLCAAALLHDIGKLEEMSGGLVNEYTDAGRFLGHITQGLIMMEPHLVASGLENAQALHFRHLILSHHGELEYGSPKQPATAEAFVLHYADNIDAKIAQWRSLFPSSEEHASGEEMGKTGLDGLQWSPRQNLLGRALCRVPRTPDTASVLAQETDVPAVADAMNDSSPREETCIPGSGDTEGGNGDGEAGSGLSGGSEDAALVEYEGVSEACMQIPSPLNPWTEEDMRREEERMQAESSGETQQERKEEASSSEGGRRRRKGAGGKKETAVSSVSGGTEGKTDKAKDLMQCSLL